MSSLDRYNQADETRQQKRKRLGRDHGVAAPLASGPRVARKIDPDSCPDGYDPDIWHLALFFEQRGRLYDAPSIGCPVIYAILEQQIERSGVRDRWPGPAKADPDKHGWVWVLEQAIEYWWDYEMDTSRPKMAARDFCEPVMFDQVVSHVVYQAWIARPHSWHKQQRPVVDPEVRRRNSQRAKDHADAVRRRRELGR